MTWYAYTNGTQLRFLLTPEDEDLTDWTLLNSPEGFDPSEGPWTVDGANLVIDVAARKLALRALVKAKRDEVEFGGVMTEYGRVETNPDSQRKLVGASTAALALGDNFSKEWRMADDSIVTLNANAMIALGLAVVAHVDACQQNKNSLDAQIESASTATELDLININSGWPNN